MNMAENADFRFGSGFYRAGTTHGKIMFAVYYGLSRQ